MSPPLLPPPLRVMMQACAAGQIDAEMLATLREDAPRFVDMLRNGLMTDMATLKRRAETGQLTIADVAEAMR